MARLIPKSVSEDKWKPLTANHVYAIRSNSEDVVFIRLGIGKSFYLEISPTQMGARMISSVEYESGGTALLTKLSDQGTITIGRASPSMIKIALPIVSRHHLEIILDDSILLVKDLGSLNGTFCHRDNVSFDIEKYLETHPLDKAAGETLDEIHEAFGPTLNDFFQKYLHKKENPNDTSPDIQ